MARIFNTSDDRETKDVCLRSIAQVGTDEACEFVLDVMRSNTGGFGSKERQFLQDNAQERMLSALSRNYEHEPDKDLRRFLGGLLETIRKT